MPSKIRQFRCLGRHFRDVSALWKAQLQLDATLIQLVGHVLIKRLAG
jgi:hypothetical protein